MDDLKKRFATLMRRLGLAKAYRKKEPMEFGGMKWDVVIIALRGPFNIVLYVDSTPICPDCKGKLIIEEVPRR